MLNVPQNWALGNSTGDWLPTQLNSIHYDSLSPAMMEWYNDTLHFQKHIRIWKALAFTLLIIVNFLKEKKRQFYEKILK